MSTYRCLVYVIYFYICVQLFDIDIVIYKCAERIYNYPGTQRICSKLDTPVSVRNFHSHFTEKANKTLKG